MDGYEILVMKYYRIKASIGSQSSAVQEKTYLEEDHPFQIEVIAYHFRQNENIPDNLLRSFWD